MNVDHRTALQALVRLAADTDLEIFAKGRGDRESPLMAVLLACRNDALAALVELVRVDPANAESVRKLQNEVERFVELVAHVKGIREAGDNAERELEPEEREAVMAAIVDDEAQQGESE